LIIAAAVVSIAFVAYSIPPYLGFDPMRSRIPVRPDYPLHYQLLVTHIFFGSVAILTAPLQLWTWLRQHHAAVHRFLGRVYIFGGAIPAAIASLIIMPVSFGPPGNAVTALLWLAVTITAYVKVRRRKYFQHRRFMIYSVAITYAVLWGRIMFHALPLIPRYGPLWIPLTAETATWIGLVINLLIAQWWLERTAKRGVSPGIPA
jgi:hypothetical protein